MRHHGQYSRQQSEQHSDLASMCSGACFDLAERKKNTKVGKSVARARARASLSSITIAKLTSLNLLSLP